MRRIGFPTGNAQHEPGLYSTVNCEPQLRPIAENSSKTTSEFTPKQSY